MNSAQLKTIQSRFFHELQDASFGKKTSLPFIIDQIPSSSLVKDEEVFEVMVIGGSVWKKALCQKTNDGIKIIKTQTERPIAFKTKGDFLTFIDHELSDNTRVLALNFAYPIKPIFENRKLDGILLATPKEGKFTELIGKKIGREIENYILKKRKKSSEAASDAANAGSRFARKITVSVVNDTVCLLLSGLTKYSFEELVGGVDGTGLNFAFFLGKNKLVNLESANFDKFPQSVEGKIIDLRSDRPGKALFEKETAGAYLYKHFNLIIKERKIDYPPIDSTEELNRISLRRNYSSSEVRQLTDESRSLKDNSSLRQLTDRTITNDVNHKASEIARSLFTKSAQLVACQIAGITEFKKRGMVFNMEGGLFWKGNHYKETVEQTVKQLVPKYNVTFVEIKDSGILGAAKLVS